MAVIRARIRVKHHAAVEERGHLHAFMLHGLVPELERAAVTFLPILVEIDQHVEAALQMELLVDAEIGVDAELAAA